MITDRQAFVHVSGHPGRPELKAMYQWIRPEILVPVHGEIRHMAEQARFATKMGVPNTIVQKNGDIVRLSPDGPAHIGKTRVGRLILDGDVILPADGATMGERRRLALNGQISVAVAIGSNGRVLGEPQLKLQGVPVEEDREAFLEEATEAAAQASRKPEKDREKLREGIRLAVRRCTSRWTGKKPVVDVLMVEA